MSKRAEEAALKAHPEETRFIRDYNQLAKRQIYQEGYEQAEKDTIERAVNVLSSMLPIKVFYKYASFCRGVYSDDFIKVFRKKLEDE